MLCSTVLTRRFVLYRHLCAFIAHRIKSGIFVLYLPFNALLTPKICEVPCHQEAQKMKEKNKVRRGVGG